MNLKDTAVSLIYALVLLGCATGAGFDTFAFAFAIGDGGGQIGLAAGTLLVGTLAGGVGLVIAALGAWTQWRGISLIALVSVFIVLPAAGLYGWQGVHAFWHNSQLGMHFGFLALGISHCAIVPWPAGGETLLGPLPEVVIRLFARHDGRLAEGGAVSDFPAGKIR